MTVVSLAGRAGALVNSAGGIVIGTAVMHVCTFGFTVLAAGILDARSYGAFFALLNLLMVVSVLNMGLQTTAARRIVADRDAVAEVERAVLRVTYRTALALGAALALLSPAVTWLLQLDSIVPALLVAALAVPTTIMGGQIGILQGEQRWGALTGVYVLAGLPRIAGLGIVLWRPTEGAALLGSGLGFIAPVVLGWWALRHPRAPSDAPPARSEGVLREALHGTQSLLAFYALASVDIVVARHVLPAHDAGVYAVGLLVAKVMLFLPQFVVIVLFPSLATAEQRRRAVVRGTATVAALGVLMTAAVALTAGVAADLVGGASLRELQGRLWLFAVLGTLLSITQLLVYAVLARRGRRSIYLVWASLLAAVAAGSLTDSIDALLGVMIAVLVACTTLLLLVSLRVDGRRGATSPQTAVVAPPVQ